MDKPEAIRVLQASWPNRSAVDQPLVLEALAVIERDPELKSWWEKQQAFDRIVAAKLGQVPVPADLRARILAGKKSTAVPARSIPLAWFALAAAIMLLGVTGIALKTSMGSNQLAQNDFTETVLPLLHHQEGPDLGLVSPDRDKLMAWLKERKAPTGGLPSKVASLTTVGCQKYSVKGHDVSLVCFAMADGRIAHLFTVEQGALADPPPMNSPQYQQQDGWSTAAWSDGKMSYLLATQDSPDALKQLL